MALPIFIGVDIGGTNLRAARFTGFAHTPDMKLKSLTEAGAGPQAVIQRLEQLIRDVSPPNLVGVAGVGLIAPGPVDPFSGTVLEAPNLPGWENLPLKHIMEERLGRPVFLGNDANLAALGEWKFGAGRGHDDVLYLTISTGIGGGVISGGRLLLGAHGLAAEVGHMLAVPDGPMCSCGQRGHLEAVASGTAIGHTARARLLAGGGRHSLIRDRIEGAPDQVTSAIVGEAALAGDAFAQEIIAEAGTFIGRAVASLLHAYNPSIVICGGGVSLLGDMLLEPVRVAVRRYAMSEAYWRDCPIVIAELGDDAGLIGAGVLAMEQDFTSAPT
ncbi:MAG TPA: ROK family protein [Anaerolineae bacterium]